MNKNFLKFWFPLYSYAALIFILSSNPQPPSLKIPFLDEFLHLIEYAIFGFLAARAFRNSKREILIKNFKFLAVLISILYGFTDEFHQSFVPNRTAQASDLIMDGLGGLIGSLFYGRYKTI